MTVHMLTSRTLASFWACRQNIFSRSTASRESSPKIRRICCGTTSSICPIPEQVKAASRKRAHLCSYCLVLGLLDREKTRTKLSASLGSDAGQSRRAWTCWVAAHRPKQPDWKGVDADGQPTEAPELIVLEFELERDQYNPLVQPFERHFSHSSGADTPDSGSQTTVSAGSGPAATLSTNSEGTSSLTTIASTPRPGMHATTSDASTATSRPPSNGQRTGSSKLPRGARPQGLAGIDVDIPLDRIIESTTNHAKPLRALERMRRSGAASGAESPSNDSGSRSARRRRPARAMPSTSGTTGTMDVFAVLSQINDQLGAAPDLETFLKVTVGVIQDVCRFHRVLIYQFDESFNGQVVAELVEWGKTTDLFKGLMFPAADIPAQARQLYMINKVRLLYDRSQQTARVVLRSKEDLEHPLDMTHCYLRAMSPIHIKCECLSCVFSHQDLRRSLRD